MTVKPGKKKDIISVEAPQIRFLHALLYTTRLYHQWNTSIKKLNVSNTTIEIEDYQKNWPQHTVPYILNEDTQNSKYILLG